MSELVYKRPRDLHISDADKLNVGAFSYRTAKCVENDLAIFPKKRNVPSLWENRWFGDPSAPGMGYSKGEAVWINTEDIDEFVIGYEHVIRGYAEVNPKSSAELDRLEKLGDRDELLAFYKKLVNGDYPGVERLFCLGDLTRPAQIRISLVDDNRLPPTDSNVRSEYRPAGVWRDFFEASTEDQLADQILKCFRDQESARMGLHLKDYHCSELSAPSDFLDGRLQSDFGNLVTDHKFRSHYWYQPELPEGFDYVVSQGSARFQTGVRWFRWWNSGMLEHGGTLNTEETDRFCSTSDGITRVRLDWTYSNGLVAPQYAFPTDALNALFLGERFVQPGGTPSQPEAAAVEIQRSQMGAKYRFAAELTPWCGDLAPYSTPTSERFQAYCPKELCYMSNGMFMFLSNGQSKTYSYHLRGFTRL